MKYFPTLFLLFFLAGCASNNVPAYGQKKDPFLPTLAKDCLSDKTVSYDIFNGPGWVCTSDNNIIFVKFKLQKKYLITKAEMQKRAENYCAIYEKKSKYAGKANIATFGGFDGEEYLCINK